MFGFDSFFGNENNNVNVQYNRREKQNFADVENLLWSNTDGEERKKKKEREKLKKGREGEQKKDGGKLKERNKE